MNDTQGTEKRKNRKRRLELDNEKDIYNGKKMCTRMIDRKPKKLKTVESTLATSGTSSSSPILSTEEICRYFGLKDVEVDLDGVGFETLTNYNNFADYVRPILAKENAKVSSNVLNILIASKYAVFIHQNPPNDDSVPNNQIIQTRTLRKSRKVKDDVEKMNFLKNEVTRLTKENRRLNNTVFEMRFGELSRVTKIWFCTRSKKERKAFLSNLKKIGH